MKKSSEKKKCNHYPIIGMNADVKYGGCWKIIEHSMSHIKRQCVKCGEIDVSNLTSYNSEMFQTEKARIERNHQRNIHAKDMLQPIDSKTGRFNEDFGRVYGYNPLKTPAPIVNRPDDEIDKQMANDNIDSNKIKLRKLKK